MRKLKLQSQVSLDGFIAGPNGEMDWMVWNWDDELKDYVTKLTEPVDLILLGRKLAEGFIPHWESAASKPDADWFSHRMTDSQKIVFSNSLNKSQWNQTALARKPLAEEVNTRKKESGGDIIAYGGATFVSSLIQHNLIDDYHLFVNPVALGEGLPIFKGKNRLNLELVKATQFACGIVVLNYKPKS